MDKKGILKDLRRAARKVKECYYHDPILYERWFFTGIGGCGGRLLVRLYGRWFSQKRAFKLCTEDVLAIDTSRYNLSLLLLNPKNRLKIGKWRRGFGACRDIAKEFVEKEFTRGNGYLFRINAKLEDDLNKGNVSENLKNAFTAKKNPLSKKAVITKERDDKWVITDSGKKIFVRKEDGKLNIYENTVTNKFKRLGIENSDACLLITSLGGGTGSGGNQILSEKIKNEFRDIDIPLITLGVLPFYWEAHVFHKNSIKAMEEFYRYLFSMDIGLEDDLNKGIFSEDLEKAFKTKKFPLSGNASISKERADKWMITGKEKIYGIRKEDGKLNIYNNSSDLLILVDNSILHERKRIRYINDRIVKIIYRITSPRSFPYGKMLDVEDIIQYTNAEGKNVIFPALYYPMERMGKIKNRVDFISGIGKIEFVDRIFKDSTMLIFPEKDRAKEVIKSVLIYFYIPKRLKWISEECAPDVVAEFQRRIVDLNPTVFFVPTSERYPSIFSLCTIDLEYIKEEYKDCWYSGKTFEEVKKEREEAINKFFEKKEEE